MFKFKKNLKFYLTIVFICFFVVGGTVLADTIVNNYYGNVELNQSVDSDNLGSVEAIGGICDGSEPTTQLCNVNIYELEIQNNLTYDGIENDWIEGDCADATTTILAVANPWGADVYVDVFQIEITNGTTTITVDIGSSTNAFSAPSENLLDDVSIATSTNAFIYNTTGVVASAFDQLDPGTNSQDIMKWDSDKYIVGLVTEVGGTGGITGDANTFSCTYKIHSYK